MARAEARNAGYGGLGRVSQQCDEEHAANADPGMGGMALWNPPIFVCNGYIWLTFRCIIVILHRRFGILLSFDPFSSKPIGGISWLAQQIQWHKKQTFHGNRMAFLRNGKFPAAWMSLVV